MISASTILTLLKQSMRINTTTFDGVQIEHLVTAAQLDLGVAGVVVPDEYDALVDQAIITYVMYHFGLPEDAERLKKSYDEQKAQLVTCTGYTDWGGSCV